MKSVETFDDGLTRVAEESKLCKCGHICYRHFDGYGPCFDCNCKVFQEKEEEKQ